MAHIISIEIEITILILNCFNIFFTFLTSESAAEPESRSRELCCVLLQTKHTTDREKKLTRAMFDIFQVPWDPRDTLSSIENMYRRFLLSRKCLAVECPRKSDSSNSFVIAVFVLNGYIISKGRDLCGKLSDPELGSEFTNGCSYFVYQQ